MKNMLSIKYKFVQNYKNMQNINNKQYNEIGREMKENSGLAYFIKMFTFN